MLLLFQVNLRSFGFGTVRQIHSSTKMVLLINTFSYWAMLHELIFTQLKPCVHPRLKESLKQHEQKRARGRRDGMEDSNEKKKKRKSDRSILLPVISKINTANISGPLLYSPGGREIKPSSLRPFAREMLPTGQPCERPVTHFPEHA